MDLSFLLFPVGALTSKPYSFVSRPWEIEVVSSFDYYDSFMLPIKFNCRGGTVVRVLPEKLVNFDRWISDKVRFSYDGFYTQRMTNPQIKVFSGMYKNLTWSAALRYWYLHTNSFSDLDVYMGGNNDLFDQSILANFCSFLGYYPDSNKNKFPVLSSTVAANNYSGLKTMLQDLANADFNQKFILLLAGGVNLRYEFPTLNLQFRKFVKSGSLIIYAYGSVFNSNHQNFSYFSLGSKITELSAILFSKNLKFLVNCLNSILYIAACPSLFLRSDAMQIYSILNNFYFRMSKYFKKYLNTGSNVLNLLPDPSSSTALFWGLSSYNFLFCYTSEFLPSNRITCLVNTDDLQLAQPDQGFSICCNHHYSVDKNFNFDLMLPTPLPWEIKNQFYVNLLGSFKFNYSQTSLQPFTPLARKFGLILRNFVCLFFRYNNLFKWLNVYFSFYLTNWFSSFWLSSPLFRNLDYYYSEFFENQNFLIESAIGKYSLSLDQISLLDYKINNTSLINFYLNTYYQTDSVSKSSYLMAVSSVRFNSCNYNFLNLK